MENSTDLIVRLDEHSIIRYISPSVTTMLGWQPEQMLGRPSADFRHPDDTGSVSESLAQPGLPVVSNRRLRHADGSYRRLETTARAVPTGHGRFEVLSTSRDITDRYEAERELERRATHDPLTGLPNRDLLGRRLSDLLQRISHAAAATPGGKAVEAGEGAEARGAADASAAAAMGQSALLFLDLDGFKMVNDTHGHPAGDELLQQVAQRLAALIRPGDTLARFGGDEFVLLLTGLPDHRDALAGVAARVEFALTAPYYLRTGTVSIGCSLGAVGVEPGSTALELLAQADAAMYAHKHPDKPETQRQPRQPSRSSTQVPYTGA